MKVTILSSDDDIASQSIRKQLLENYDFRKIEKGKTWSSEHFLSIFQLKTTEFDGNIEIYLAIINLGMIYIDQYFDKNEIPGDLIVFASRHSSKTGKPALLCHTPGNWDSDAKYGGKKFHIAKGSGIAMHYFFKNLTKFASEEKLPFAVDQEVTHHGPSEIEKPVIFIELGSNEKGWKNQEAASVVAKTIITSLKTIANKHFENGMLLKKNIKVCVGFGGTHYMSNLSKLNKYGCGLVHVMPKYRIDGSTIESIKQIPKKSLESIDYWVIDWKGVNSAQKEKLIGLLNELGWNYIKRKKLQKKLKKSLNSQPNL